MPLRSLEFCPTNFTRIENVERIINFANLPGLDGLMQ